MKRFLLTLTLFFLGATLAFGYDATGNFSQAQPELVSGWYLKAGPTKGGPYPSITDCGKPAPKVDGTYDCTAKGWTANPVYAVVANYDGTKKEIATSPESALSITVQPPSNLKLVVTVQTVARLTRYGNPITTTTISKKSVGQDVAVVEGSKSYRNRRGEYVTTTTIVM